MDWSGVESGDGGVWGGMGLSGSLWGGLEFGLEADCSDNLDLGSWTCSLMEEVGWEWESGC